MAAERRDGTLAPPAQRRDGTLAPPVQRILDAGAHDGSIRGDVWAEDLIHALSRLSGGSPTGGTVGTGLMTQVLLDGVCAPARRS